MLFIRILAKLPFRLLYFISGILGWILHYIVGYRKKVVYENLRKSFPEKSPAEIKRIARDFYTRFTDYAVETLKVLEMSFEEIINMVDVTYDDEFLEVIKKKQPIILLLSHQFNWELGAHSSMLRIDAPFEGVYKRLSNKKFDAFMKLSREYTGSTIIEKSSLVKHIIRTRKEFKILVLLADQRPRRSGPQFWTTFLNQETSFVKGPSSLAKLMNAYTYLLSIERTHRGHYKAKIDRLTEPPYEKDDESIIEAYAQGLESIIRNDPAGYLWSHNRWKNKREDVLADDLRRQNKSAT